MQTIDRPSARMPDGSYRHELGWFHRLIATRPDAAPLIARLALGLAMFPHGAQKALGWFGGPGFGGTIAMFGNMMHIPAWLAVLAIAAEFLGSLGLIVGLLGRVATFGIFCNMLVATLMVHSANGFFMNWMGNQKGEGFEYHVLAMGLALVVMIAGSGLASIDRMWQDRRELR
jgi:putative oxidoreductase